MRAYEFVRYDQNVMPIATEVLEFKSDSAARSRAGRFAKADNGPCDLAEVGIADWGDRYMTTAIPSKYHATGYQFERITI